jgi:hypothetical protein
MGEKNDDRHDTPYNLVTESSGSSAKRIHRQKTRGNNAGNSSKKNPIDTKKNFSKKLGHLIASNLRNPAQIKL